MTPEEFRELESLFLDLSIHAMRVLSFIHRLKELQLRREKDKDRAAAQEAIDKWEVENRADLRRMKRAIRRGKK